VWRVLAFRQIDRSASCTLWCLTVTFALKRHRQRSLSYRTTLSRWLTFRLRHAIHAVLTQRLLIVVVASLSAILFLFLPFPLGVELNRLSVGVGRLSSDFICVSIFISAIFWRMRGAGRPASARRVCRSIQACLFLRYDLYHLHLSRFPEEGPV
jgi:hypothetical protein